MAGGVPHRELHVAQLVLLAVRHADMREVDRRGFMEQDRRACRPGEPTRTRDVVRLNVRLDDVGDPHGLLGGRLEIGLDVVLWIHHSAGSCAASAEQVARATGLRNEELAEDHGALLRGNNARSSSIHPPTNKPQYRVLINMISFRLRL
jgi:hypothetical protein